MRLMTGWALGVALVRGRSKLVGLTAISLAIGSACSVERKHSDDSRGGSAGTSGTGALGGKPSMGGTAANAGRGGISSSGGAGGGNTAGGSTASGGADEGGMSGGSGAEPGEGSGGSAPTAGAGGTTSAGGSTATNGGVANGGVANGGAANGGASAKGGTTSAGGAVGNTGGTSGGTGSGGKTSGGATGTGGSCGTGLTMCSAKCVDTTVDKANCGVCGTACEGYQFCAGSKCLPKYESTRVQPLTSGGSGVQALSAVVQKNKAQGDLMLQVDGDVTLSAPGAGLIAELHGSGYARYTSAGVLVWSKSSKLFFSDNFQASSESPMALMSNGDVAVTYRKYYPPTGPVSGTYAYLLARLGGANGTLVWETKYPSNAARPSIVVPRSAKSDFLTFTYLFSSQQLNGNVYRVVDSGTSGTVSDLGSSYVTGAAPGADGATAWLWGNYDASSAVPLSPLSTQTWSNPPNPSRTLTDSYFLGAQDAATVGPWYTEGDNGVRVDQVVVDSAGDLIVTAYAAGYATFNGGQDLFTTTSTTQMLAKINHTTGAVVWKTSIPQYPNAAVVLPGDRVLLIETWDTSLSMNIYSGANGALLSNIKVPVTGRPVVAAGTSEMFVVGPVSAATDFNPGTGVDTLGGTAGLYISRYSF